MTITLCPFCNINNDEVEPEADDQESRECDTMSTERLEILSFWLSERDLFRFFKISFIQDLTSKL